MRSGTDSHTSTPCIATPSGCRNGPAAACRLPEMSSRNRLRPPHDRVGSEGRSLTMNAPARSVAEAAPTISIRNYAIVTTAYWAFTLTDGALRMLVLLHFNQLGYTPVQLAFLFLLYEFFGIVTNLVGGWVASRTGLRFTLVFGLVLQVVALGLLALLNRGWSTAL